MTAFKAISLCVSKAAEAVAGGAARREKKTGEAAFGAVSPTASKLGGFP